MKVLIDGVEYIPIHECDKPEGLPPGYLSPHFKEAEFTCNHCGSLEGHIVPQELLHVLEDLRHHFGDGPVTITSGYRCKTHNTNVGSSEKSQHRKATAADVQLRNASPVEVHRYLTQSYPNKYGIGRYDSFTHIDVRPEKARW
jgi:hypothetical protein